MGEPQFIEGKVVGDLDLGVFTQRIFTRHIYRLLNAKGMDVRLHRALRGKCRLWRLEFGDTHQVISIPYARIELSGVRKKPKPEKVNDPSEPDEKEEQNAGVNGAEPQLEQVAQESDA